MQLDVRLEGVAPPVGTLARFDDGGTAFLYHPDYLALPGAFPISLSLPFSSLAFPDFVTRAFFENLLQENDQLRRVLVRERLGRDDIVGILYHVGSDCAGALSCLPVGAPPVKVPGRLDVDYDPLPPDVIDDYVDRLANRRPLPAEARDPSPVAGVQNKLSLCFYGSFAFAPKRGVGVPTTHILKVPPVGEPDAAVLELMCAELARHFGFDVAATRLQMFGPHPALVVDRFDRIRAPDGAITRVHQEDFAQAFGLPSALKYQRGDEGFDAPSANAVLGRTARPALARQEFLRATVFNLAIGNNDNHAKNHALLYDGGGAPRLAPLYDLVPVRLNPNPDISPDFAFAIGDARRFEELRRRDLETLMNDFGLFGEAAQRFKLDALAPLLMDLMFAASLLEPRFSALKDLIARQAEALAELLGVTFV